MRPLNNVANGPVHALIYDSEHVTVSDRADTHLANECQHISAVMPASRMRCNATPADQSKPAVGG